MYMPIEQIKNLIENYYEIASEMYNEPEVYRHICDNGQITLHQNMSFEKDSIQEELDETFKTSPTLVSSIEDLYSTSPRTIDKEKRIENHQSIAKKLVPIKRQLEMVRKDCTNEYIIKITTDVINNFKQVIQNLKKEINELDREIHTEINEYEEKLQEHLEYIKLNVRGWKPGILAISLEMNQDLKSTDEISWEEYITVGYAISFRLKKINNEWEEDFNRFKKLWETHQLQKAESNAIPVERYSASMTINIEEAIDFMRVARRVASFHRITIKEATESLLDKQESLNDFFNFSSFKEERQEEYQDYEESCNK